MNAPLSHSASTAAFPAGFLFSQSNLQDYVDCRRRFLLRYVFNVAWPGLESEPALESERFMRLGERFHRLAQQYFIGAPPEALESSIREDELLQWWGQFARFASGLRQSMFISPELTVSAPLEDHRLLAKFDLVLMNEAGKFIIYDWKTARRRPRRERLIERMQTHVYPYLLARCGAGFHHGEAIPPESIELIYWFPAFPDQPERIAYSAARFQADHALLTNLVREIKQAVGNLSEAQLADPPGGEVFDSAFPMTTQIERCAYCVYRSLCNRGERAGDFGAEAAESELEDFEVHIDFEQVAEIAF